MFDNVMFEIYRMNMWELCLSNFLAATMMLTWVGVVVFVRRIVKAGSRQGVEQAAIIKELKHDLEYAQKEIGRHEAISKSATHDYWKVESRFQALEDTLKSIKEAPDVEDAT